jgi:mannose-1-phosphate guanylyltransferase/phosphomannomutase
MQIVIIAGGLGTRSKLDCAKILANIQGRTLLEHQLDSISRNAVSERIEVMFLLGFDSINVIENANKIVSKYKNLDVSFHVEKFQSGTAGALLQSFDFLQEDFIVVLGDLFFEFDFFNFYRYSQGKNSEITAVVHPNGHSWDSDSAQIDLYSNKITGINFKKGPKIFSAYQSLAGIFFIEKKLLTAFNFESETSIDIVSELLSKALESSNFSNKVYGYLTTEYVKDSGTPDRLRKISNDIQDGIPTKRSRKFQKPAIFVDRDDTLMADRADSNFELSQDIIDAILGINHLGIPVIVATNQPCIAKGGNLDSLDKELYLLSNSLESKSAYIDAWYICPHHPDDGFPEENRFFKVHCKCRKPKTGLFEFAQKDHSISLPRSIIIGDSEADYKASIAVSARFFHTSEFRLCEMHFAHRCFSSTAEALSSAGKEL